MREEQRGDRIAAAVDRHVEARRPQSGTGRRMTTRATSSESNGVSASCAEVTSAIFGPLACRASTAVSQACFGHDGKPVSHSSSKWFGVAMSAAASADCTKIRHARPHEDAAARRRR